MSARVILVAPFDKTQIFLGVQEGFDYYALRPAKNSIPASSYRKRIACNNRIWRNRVQIISMNIRFLLQDADVLCCRAKIYKMPIMQILNSFITSSQGPDIAAFLTQFGLDKPLIVPCWYNSSAYQGFFASPWVRQLNQTPLTDCQRYNLRYK